MKLSIAQKTGYLVIALVIAMSLVACGSTNESLLSSDTQSVTNESPLSSDTQSVADSIVSIDELSVPQTQSQTVDSAERDTISAILKDSDFYFLEETDALASYYAQAAERKVQILNSPTEIVKSDTFIRGETYTGKAYYVSPNGNDNNDGLSPETAWQTPARTCWGEVQEGDAVFFERGGVYRLIGEGLQLISNVTYSAYGEGAKPVITLSQENSAQNECWELYSEGENGEKIWHYYKQTGDVGGIVFDDSSYAKRILEWPTPDGWLAVDMLPMDPVNGVCAPEDPGTNISVKSAGEYRTIEQQLTENLTYLCRTDIAGMSYPIEFVVDFPRGDLYLRCDEGNPGELFSDIEIIAVQPTRYNSEEAFSDLLSGYEATGYVIDNLSLKYYLDSALGTLPDRSANEVIQNCTIEWGGNRLFDIQDENPTNNYSLIGDSVYGLAKNVVIRNNYFRQGGNSCTFENSFPNMPNAGDYGTYLVEGNLIENCGQGIRTYFIEPECEYAFDALIIRDNIILNTGDGMNNACNEIPVAIDLGTDPVQFAKKFEISDNIMIGSTLAMVRIADSNSVDYDFHNNVIVQSRDGALIGEYLRTSISWHMMKDVK